MEGDWQALCKACHDRNFNPLPPYGGRLVPAVTGCSEPAFQSTPSVWRETSLLVQLDVVVGISIHSLRMEGDDGTARAFPCSTDFNPLPPYGGRPPDL